jgi:hypothetical protein
MKLDFSCRVHTVNPSDLTRDEEETKIDPPRLPPSIVVFDTETVENLALDFEFGCYAYCELVNGIYISREQGILYRDLLQPKFERVIREYAHCTPAHLGELAQTPIRVRTRTEFVKNVFWPTLRAGGAAVGVNLGFLSAASALTFRFKTSASATSTTTEPPTCLASRVTDGISAKVGPPVGPR